MRTVKFAVCHYSASPEVSIDTIRQWHLARGFSDVGYHALIHRDGRIEKGRPVEQIGAHTKGHNQYSLGVCLTGSNDMSWYPTSRQYQALTSLLGLWMSEYNFSTWYFHRDLGSTLCPGRLDKERIKKMLEGGDELSLEDQKKITELFIRTDIMIGQIEHLYREVNKQLPGIAPVTKDEMIEEIRERLKE